MGLNKEYKQYWDPERGYWVIEKVSRKKQMIWMLFWMGYLLGIVGIMAVMVIVY